MKSRDIRDVEALIEYFRTATRMDYVFFWGHRQPMDCNVNESCLSQWYPAEFEIDSVHYPTAEHFMMAEKARLFNDSQTEQQIMAAPSPQDAKDLGRQVRNFDTDAWTAARQQIVITGNLAKFSADRELQDYLIKTGDDVLVEASPTDRIWGIGLDRDNAGAVNPLHWRGLNLLGFALMDVRAQLLASHT